MPDLDRGLATHLRRFNVDTTSCREAQSLSDGVVNLSARGNAGLLHGGPLDALPFAVGFSDLTDCAWHVWPPSSSFSRISGGGQQGTRRTCPRTFPRIRQADGRRDGAAALKR